MDFEEPELQFECCDQTYPPYTGPIDLAECSRRWVQVLDNNCDNCRTCQEYTGFKLMLPSEKIDFLTNHVRDFVKNPPKRFLYLVTFTLSPTLFPKEALDKERHVERAKEYVYRQHLRKQLKPLEVSVVEELQQNGNPHWHMLYLTSAPLAKSRFIQYTRNFGNVDVSKSGSGDKSYVYDYINKTNESQKLL